MDNGGAAVETLLQFRTRTQGFSRDSLPVDGKFVTSEGLRDKVDEQGEMLPFEGNTTVFLLDSDAGDRIRHIQKRLYEECGDMLAVPLIPESFHMTLHDLKSGRAGTVPRDEIQKCGKEALEILREIRSKEREPIAMRMTWVFNMVNTSIVTGFEPAGEKECRRLMEMYEELQKAVRLPYPLTPHVTAAYYKPGRYDPKTVEKLAKVFRSLSAERFTLDLRMEDLVCQEFFDMSHYKTILG